LELGISRPTLHDLLKRHSIDAASFRRPGTVPDESEA
jgi:hypothetical protein